MKKIRVVSMAVAVVMGVTLFVGCGKTDTTKSTATVATATTQKPVQAVTLKIWGGVPAENGPDKICENFTKEFESKGIKAVYERFVNDENGNLKLDTALMAGEDVDMFIGYSLERAKKRVLSKVSLDLTPYLEKDKFDLEKEIGPIAKEYYIDNKPYMLPTTKGTTNAWIVNKDMFDAAGIAIPTDWTIDDLRDISKKLTKGEGANKVYGFLLNSENTRDAGLVFAATKLGGDYLYKDNKDAESNFDNADIIKSLKTMTDMMLVDKTALPHADMIAQKLVATNLFAEGKVAIAPHSWVIRDLKDLTKYPHKFKTAFVPTPKMDKNQKDYYAQGGLSDFVTINANSNKKDQSWEYMKWYATKGIIDMVPGGRIPAYKKFDMDAVTKLFLTGSENIFDEKTFKDVYLKSYDKYILGKLMTKLPELQQISREECEKAMANGTTPELAMQSAKKRGDALLKK